MHAVRTHARSNTWVDVRSPPSRSSKSTSTFGSDIAAIACERAFTANPMLFFAVSLVVAATELVERLGRARVNAVESTTSLPNIPTWWPASCNPSRCALPQYGSKTRSHSSIPAYASCHTQIGSQWRQTIQGQDLRTGTIAFIGPTCAHVDRQTSLK